MKRWGVNPAVVGQLANDIANAGVKVPKGTKASLQSPHPSLESTFAGEAFTVLAYFVCDDYKHGLNMLKMLELGGGTFCSNPLYDEDIPLKYGEVMRAGRIIVNSPSSQGAIGDIYNTNTPSLTLGCGTYGRNSTTSNVSTVNLVNKKRVAKRRVNMQWFKIPPKIYFEKGSIQYLEQMPNITRAFIVTDPTMVELGYVDKALYYLRKRKVYCHSEIFSGRARPVC